MASIGRRSLRIGYPIVAGRRYPTNWNPAANGVALARPGLGLVIDWLARWFRVYLGLGFSFFNLAIGDIRDPNAKWAVERNTRNRRQKCVTADRHL